MFFGAIVRYADAANKERVVSIVGLDEVGSLTPGSLAAFELAWPVHATGELRAFRHDHCRSDEICVTRALAAESKTP